MFKLTIEFKTADELILFLKSKEAQQITISEPVPKSRTVPKPAILTGRKNKPGGGRPKGTTKKVAKKAKKPVVDEQEEDFEIDDGPVEVAEPANKFIMDEFDKNQEAELKENETSDIDSFLDAEVEQEAEAEVEVETVSKVKAKNATKSDVSNVVTELLQRKKEEGKDGVGAVKKVLAAHNIERLRDLDPGHYGHFVQQIQSVM